MATKIFRFTVRYILFWAMTYVPLINEPVQVRASEPPPYPAATAIIYEPTWQFVFIWPTQSLLHCAFDIWGSIGSSQSMPPCMRTMRSGSHSSVPHKDCSGTNNIYFLFCSQPWWYWSFVLETRCRTCNTVRSTHAAVVHVKILFVLILHHKQTFPLALMISEHFVFASRDHEWGKWRQRITHLLHLALSFETLLWCQPCVLSTFYPKGRRIRKHVLQRP
jgi:hypothetical protein